MLNILIWIACAVFVAGAGFNVYWQSQINIRARYKYMPAIITAVFVGWLFVGVSFSFGYIVLISLFMTVGIMDGVGGIGEKRLVASGFFANVFEYSKLSHVTLIPINLGTKDRVVAIFSLGGRRTSQMIFNNELSIIKNELEKHINDSTKIEIGSIQ